MSDAQVLIRRALLVFVLALYTAVSVVAQSAWDGTSASNSLQAKSDEMSCINPNIYPKGSRENPWLIKSPLDLKYLQQNPDLWGKGIYFEQTDDIDLNNKELGLIGRGGVTQIHFFTSTTIASTEAFRGVYNGNGKKISNAVVYWDNDNQQNAFGLFGFVTGTLKNMIIENVKVTHSAARTKDVTISRDLKIGVLCGAVAPDPDGPDKAATIENIIITGSSIDDGSGNYKLTLGAAFVGGLVGDITRGYQSTYGMQAADSVKICNIYVGVNINLLNTTTSNSNKYQFNVGGIYGRMRSGHLRDVPCNTIYSGRICAPRAMVGPVFASSRVVGGNDYNLMFSHYYGQFVADNNTVDSPSDYIQVPTTFSNTRYFRKYYIYDCAETATDKYKLMTSASPGSVTTSPKSGETVTLRVLDQNVGQSGYTNLLDTDASFRAYQGVNHGTYIDAESTTAMTDAINGFNDDLSAKKTGFQWTWSTDGGVETIDMTPVASTTYSMQVNILPELPLRAICMLQDEFGNVVNKAAKYEWYVHDNTDERNMLYSDNDLPFTDTDGDFHIPAPLGTGFRLYVRALDADDNQLAEVDDIMLNQVQVRFLTDPIDNNILRLQYYSPAFSSYTYNSGFSIAWTVTNGVEGTDYELLDDEVDGLYTAIKLLNEGLNTTLTATITEGVYTNTTQHSTSVTITLPSNTIYVYNRENTRVQRSKHSAYATIYDTYKSNGNDANDGRTPETAVLTLKEAYRKLAGAQPYTIVVMGYLDDATNKAYWTAETMKEGYMQKPVTVTGADPTHPVITDGMIRMAGSDTNHKMMAAPTTLRDITLNGGGGGELYLYCNQHDLTIDHGVRIEGYGNLNANTNGLNDAPAPKITIVGGFHNYYNPGVKFSYVGNDDPTHTTINIRSGCFGRIIASARNTGNNPNQILSHNIFGTPDDPHRVVVNIDIDNVIDDVDTHGIGKGGTGPDYVNTSTNPYLYDIGLLVGGQTDGTVYVEAEVNLEDGNIGRAINGNISYGRAIAGNYPDDSFYGISIVNIKGGKISELVGGNLGRVEGGSPCQAYFYGRSIINVDGGTINANIYGAGQGGVSGLVCADDDTKFTDDPNIAYLDNGVVKYGPYATVKTKDMPTMPLKFDYSKEKVGSSTLDLAVTKCEVNIIKGRVEGNVYGGGYGYSKQIETAKALDKAGSIFGDATVHISGGTVVGSVYGGGEGSSIYADESSSTSKFRTVATIYGNTSVEMSGGTVEGDMYAGSKGVEGFADIARILGSASLSLTGGAVDGDVYGGSELATICKLEGDTEGKTGNTSVVLNGGKVNGAVYGCNNISGTPQGHAKVHVMQTVPYDTNRTYHVAAVYGGGNQAAYVPTTNLATEFAEVIVEDCSSSIEYVYGGGNAAPVPATQVTIYGASGIGQVFGGGNGANLAASGAHVGYNAFGCVLPASTTQYGTGKTAVQIYGGKIDEVFGGSNTCGYIATGTNVQVNNSADNPKGYCAIKIGAAYSAGNEAEMNCPGTLDVNCADEGELTDVFGGAKNADINSDIVLNIKGGSFDRVFGGNNLGGNITGKIEVNVDETSCRPIIIGDAVYGGGNLAAYDGVPVVNIYSCSYIANVYGGGLGAGATVRGTKVNINQIPGMYKPGTVDEDSDGKITYTKAALDSDGNYVHNLTGDNALLGYIGNVYGGGDRAKVLGNTEVNIATVASVKPLTRTETLTKIGANITGNVYGGGHLADVTGKTNVVVGRE